jgi:hypothetical protein
MAELHITRLDCLNRQDTINQDDVVLQINGSTISGPHTNMSAGDSVNLNVQRTFTGAVSVSLVELDNTSSDDLLGTVVVSAALAGQGTQTGRYHQAPGADYHMEFHVH